MTDNLGQSQVIPYLIGLRKKGYEIHILSCEKQNVYVQRKEVISELLYANKIYWHPIKYTPSPQVISTLKDIKNLKKTASQIVVQHNINLLHCRSYISAGIGMYIQKKFSIPWIFDMRGFWADERVEGGIWNLKNPLFKTIYKHFKRKEQRFIANANHIISLTKNGKNEIEKWNSYKQNKAEISVIPCCADLDYFSFENISEEVKTATRTELSIEKTSFVLSYLGSFGTWYMTEEMFEFFAVFHKKNPDSVFLCITPDNPTLLQNVAKSKGISADSLRIIKANREDVARYASVSDWSMFFIKPVYSKKASSPTKMGELLGLGIPLICNNNVGDVEEIMQSCLTGQVVSEFSIESYSKIADAVLSIKDYKKEDLRKVAEQVYSLENGVEMYSKVYGKLIG